MANKFNKKLALLLISIWPCTYAVAGHKGAVNDSRYNSGINTPTTSPNHHWEGRCTVDGCPLRRAAMKGTGYSTEDAKANADNTHANAVWGMGLRAPLSPYGHTDSADRVNSYTSN